MADARGFAVQLDRELDVVISQWDQVIRKIGLEALSRIVLKTPVDTGRARGNWLVQIGGAGIEVTSEIDSSGAVTIAKGSNVIGTFKLKDGDQIISLYNNLPYINRLENGWSKIQAPAGMVAVTVAELEAGL